MGAIGVLTAFTQRGPAVPSLLFFHTRSSTPHCNLGFLPMSGEGSTRHVPTPDDRCTGMHPEL